ncbi:Uncharacterized protein Adt_35573 [Abeliophyllum distichum]|uniref:RNase H type-1 domain-containing protein n=1 Tax=Abeliophyllum distichum TaxID=126358 RepID=A0ABD1QF48_9LAMI
MRKDTSDGRFTTKSTWQLVRTGHTIQAVYVDVVIQRRIGSHMASRCQCCSAIETIQHLFIDSCVANQVWRHLLDIFHVTLRPMEGFEYHFQSWRFSGQFVRQGHIRTIVPLLILWFIWTARNDAKYQDIYMEPKRIIWKVYHTISLLHTGCMFRVIHWRGDMDITPLFGISLTTPSLSPPVLIYWRTPPEGSYKVNTDGRVKDGLVSGGEIIRDSSSQCVRAFFSSYAIHCITRGGGPWSIQATLRHIRHLLTFDRDTISHIYHKGNQVDDLLASEGWDRRCYFAYSAQDLPRRYRGLVQIDRHGIPTVRGL